MKKIITPIVFLFFVLSEGHTQSFSIHLSPDTLTLSVGETGTLSLNATTTGGFNGSIFLSLESFSNSQVIINPAILNPPYDNCSVVVSASSLSPGNHELIIKGQQGEIISFDTAIIKIQPVDPDMQWYQLNHQNSGLLCNDNIAIAKDNFNNMLISSNLICPYPNRGIVSYNHLNWEIWNNNSYTLRDFYGTLISQVNNSMLSSCGGDVRDIAVDSANVRWIGTSNGLIRQDDANYITLFWGEDIWSVSARNNKICVGTSYNGLKYFDGDVWHSFTTANSYLPSNNIRVTDMENDSLLWIGTDNGLAYFDLHFWTIYNSSNSILPDNIITAIEVDQSNNKWISTLGSGLIEFDNSEWHEFQPPCSAISAICSDHQNNIWLGFQSGNANNALVSFDGINWTVYNSANSGFNSDYTTAGYGRINAIEEDDDYTLWISTFGDGIFIYNPSGLSETLPGYLEITDQVPVKKTASLFTIYPNPNNGEFFIKSNAENSNDYTISLYSIQGKIIDRHFYTFDSFDLKSISYNGLQDGVYFLNISSIDACQTFKLVINDN